MPCGTGRPSDRNVADFPKELLENIVPAARAGKDVYSEKPCGLTIELCQRLDDTIRETGRVFQAGTQRLMQLDSIYFSPMEWSGTMPMMNWASTGGQVRWILRDPATGRENMDVAWRFRRGEPVRIRLLNQRESFHAMQHPIHLHGQRFAVVARNGRRVRDHESVRCRP